ncbi:hemerythrin domain-containing protein [Cupriavidus sp. WKF15]|uniref:bacteriohemerythrin n=1 Tax=Cupriavidus sp. WKF15 TaxID=3032282 RepID=UPI0023E2A545|nr:hemerythrin domain-containing protein [Cupriavidus sp. WKF15]WER46581.1 hemerythrin domain-containing protein [Cupriavidus sp. WKF15]
MTFAHAKAHEVTLAWNDKLKLGLAAMDDTHEEFVEIVNEMLTCADEDVARCLDLFERHAEAHFLQEEMWMQTSGFPSMDCHVKEHEAVVASVREVQALLRSGGALEVARRLAAELARWFPAHADYLDAALAQWIVKRSHGGPPIVVRRNMQFDG